MDSIEWLQQELMKSIYFQRLINDLESRKTQIELNVFEQAKQMRDQEIRDACGMALSKLLYQQAIEKNKYNGHIKSFISLFGIG